MRKKERKHKMKILSLTEPYATLIKEKVKKVETRSWKTNYRGEIYIHVSKTKIPKATLEKQELMALCANYPLNFGKIICKAELVDCIPMTKEYVLDMKQNHPQEYICGDYQEGRYAFVLENISPIENPLEVKGKLGLWEYYTEDEIMEIMSQIEYGWVDKNQNPHQELGEDFEKNYQLQSPSELLKSKIGVCYDQVELERYYFSSHLEKVTTYCIVYEAHDHHKTRTHTFLTYEKSGKYYWFEHAWENAKGIHEYPSLMDLFYDMKEKFIIDQVKEEVEANTIYFFEYQKPNWHLSAQEFFNHIIHGKERACL